jgi:hypothetical protein
MDEEVEAGADLEIEIVDPEMVTLDDGSVEITIIPDADMGDMSALRRQPSRGARR